PAALRLEEEEQIACASPTILKVVALPLPGPRWQGLTHLVDELIELLIETHQRLAGPVFLHVQLQHILHAAHILGIDLRDAPLLLQARLDLVFFRVLRTDSSLIASTTLSSTSRSASNCRVQRWRPWGGSEQASATSIAASLPWSFGAAPGRGCSLSAASRPSSPKRLRSLPTVVSATKAASLICWSVLPSSARSNTWARRTLRAALLPRLIRCRSSILSSSVSSTMYRFSTGPPPAGLYATPSIPGGGPSIISVAKHYGFELDRIFGMDFLTRAGAVIDLERMVIELRSEPDSASACRFKQWPWRRKK